MNDKVVFGGRNSSKTELVYNKIKEEINMKKNKNNGLPERYRKALEYVNNNPSDILKIDSEVEVCGLPERYRKALEYVKNNPSDILKIDSKVEICEAPERYRKAKEIADNRN